MDVGVLETAGNVAAIAPVLGLVDFGALWNGSNAEGESEESSDGREVHCDGVWEAVRLN